MADGLWWSILIAGIPERYHSVQPLLHALLEQQAASRIAEIEVLYLMDNRRRDVGAKRNALMEMARGEYVSFIDDDDRVAEDYVRRIYRAIKAGRKANPPPDVITFRQIATLAPHNITHDCSYSLEFYRNRPPEARRQLAPLIGEDGKPSGSTLLWTGPPAHTQVWRRGLVGAIKFPESNFGEDVAWVDRACERASNELSLGDSPLYFYDFNEATSATR